MTTMQATSSAGSQTQRSAFRRLAWLAIANILAAAVVTGLTYAVGLVQPAMYRQLGSSRILQILFFCIGVGGPSIIGGQAVAGATIAALVPQRRFVGLFVATAFALALGSVGWLGMVVRSPAQAAETLPVIWGQCLALGVFVIAQGLRFLLGWRLTLDGESADSGKNQFGTADLIEWMISIGYFLGLGSVCGWYHNLRLLGMLLAWHAAITLPLGFAILSSQGLSFKRGLIVIGSALLATAIYHSVNWYFVPLGLPAWMLASQMLVPLMCYLVATAVNVGIVRRIGYRWAERRTTG